jgi:uncharacterized protein YbaR (Trm112 family)
MEDFLVCAFSNKSLRFMTEKELAVVNAQLHDRQLFFYCGAPLNFELTSALMSETQAYIYPVIDDIIYLQKQTAIVSKNRTHNPLKRVTQKDTDQFYQDFGFSDNPDLNFPKDLRSHKLGESHISELASLLPKKGNSFLSISTHDVDAIHNLTYRNSYGLHFHMDFSLGRLKAIQCDLPQNTIFVLGEMNCLPFKNDSIDGLISFDYLNNYEKEVQNQAYLELKRCLKEDGVSILLYDKAKPLVPKNQLKSDQLSKKAFSIVAPWKKIQLPNIIFYPIDNSNLTNGNFVANPSFG